MHGKGGIEMKNENKKEKKVDYRSRLTKDQIWTIPNILSFVRLALIPLIVWLYVGLEDYSAAFIMILVSSLTDIVDGFIARRFNMITDFGKMIDPVADKLTQLAILVCLVSRFPLMLLPVCVMVVKEVVSFVIRLRLFQKSEEVRGAVWHGKLNTVILYTVICAHIVFPNAIGGTLLSTISILFSAGFMVFSFVLYTIECVQCFARVKRDKKSEQEE